MTDENKNTSQDDWLNFEDNLKDEEVETEEASPADDQEQDANEEEQPSEGESEQSDDKSETDSEVEILRKRLQDTQKWANKVNAQVQEILKKASEGEELTEEDIEALKKVSPSESNSQGFIGELEARIQSDLPTIVALSGEDEETIKGYIKAFGQLELSNPDTLQTLQTMDEAQRTAYIVKRGKEVADLYSVVSEKGSVSKALAALKEEKDKITKKAFDEGYAKAKAELEEKYSEYINPIAKPNLRSSENTSVGKGDVIDNNFVSSIFS